MAVRVYDRPAWLRRGDPFETACTEVEAEKLASLRCVWLMRAPALVVSFAHNF